MGSKILNILFNKYAISVRYNIIRTTDKGNTWNKFSLGKNKKLGRLKMFDEKYGIMLIGNYPEPIKVVDQIETIDGGLTWNKIGLPDENRLGIVDWDLINRNKLVGLIWFMDSIPKQNLLTVDLKKKAWDTLPVHNYAYYLDFINDTLGWISGGFLTSSDYSKTTQLIQKTTDGGKTWETQRDKKFNSFTVHDIIFFDNQFGMATSSLGLVLVTEDGGKHWREDILYKLPDSSPAFGLTNSVQVTSATTAYVIYDGDSVYKYTRDFTRPTNNHPDKPLKPQGNIKDSIYLDYEYITKTTDPDKDSVKYFFDWGDGKNSDWTILYDSGEQVSVTHSWDTTGNFQVRVKARDKYDLESEWSDTLLVNVVGIIKPPNHSPEIPSKPGGSIVDSIYRSYNYITKTNDLDDDSVSYFFDWGDSTVSAWSEFYLPDTQITASHSWSKPGDFIIKVKAKDTKGSISEWSDSLKISVVGKIISVEENNISSEMEIAPNPVTDFIEISYPPLESGSGGVSIKIYNVFGQNCDLTPTLSTSGEGVRIDVSGLVPGMYFVRIGDRVTKFIKM